MKLPPLHSVSRSPVALSQIDTRITRARQGLRNSGELRQMSLDDFDFSNMLRASSLVVMRGSQCVPASNSCLIPGESIVPIPEIAPAHRRWDFSQAERIATVGVSFFCVLAVDVPSAASGRLEVAFFDGGQADATLATCRDGNHRPPIDSGDSCYSNGFKKVYSHLANAFVSRPGHLDVALASQAADHIGSMTWVLTNPQVGATEFVSHSVSRVSHRLSLAITKPDLRET